MAFWIFTYRKNSFVRPFSAYLYPKEPKIDFKWQSSGQRVTFGENSACWSSVSAGGMKQGKNQDTGALNGRSRYHNESPTLQESFHGQRRVAKNRPKSLILHKFTDGLSENDTCLHCTCTAWVLMHKFKAWNTNGWHRNNIWQNSL